MQVRALKDELANLQAPCSHVGEVVKSMGKKLVLVKVHPEGKYVVELDDKVNVRPPCSATLWAHLVGMVGGFRWVGCK